MVKKYIKMMLKKQIMISGDKMKLNNRGFAITTILYGTMVLFLMLSVASLGIMSTYKIRMDKLINEEEGAECIVSGECVEPKTHTQYKKSLCIVKDTYYCTGSDAILHGGTCYFEPSSSITKETCDSMAAWTWISYKNMCYTRSCDPSKYTWCGGVCTREICGCTWNDPVWSDTDCGNLGSTDCKILETREVNDD